MSTIHSVAHGLTTGDPIYFGNLLPDTTGIVEGQVYYVLAAGLTADDFQFSETDGGVAFTLTEDILSGIVSQVAFYAPADVSDVMAPPVVAAAPTGLGLASDVGLDADGHYVCRLLASWDAATEPSIRNFIFEFSTTSGDYSAAIRVVGGSLQTSAIIPGVRGNVVHYGRLATQDVYGNLSAWSTEASVLTAVDSSAPGTPTGLVGLTGVQGLSAEWNPNSEADLAYYDVQLDDATNFISPIAEYTALTNAISIGDLAAGTYYLRIRAVDNTLNASAYTSYVTILVGDEFADSVLVGSGLTGAWEDHALTGIRNGSFASNEVDVTVVGRISSIPYWTAAASGGATIDGAIGHVKFHVNAIGESATLTSDPIRVRGGGRYYITINEHNAYTGGGALDRTITVRKYHADGTLGGTQVLDVENYVTGDNALHHTNPFVATVYGTNGEDPTDYITIEVKVNNKTGTITGSAGFLVYEVALVPWAEQFFNTNQPASPEHGDLWQADFNGEWYQYDDGTGEWTSVLVHEFIIPVNVTTTIPLTATATARWMATNPEPTYDIQIVSLQAAVFVASGGTALGASHKWVASVFASPSSTSLGTLDVDSGSSNTHRRIAASSAAVIDASDMRLTVTWTKTGTPGDLTPAPVVVQYRKTLTS
jgi:hypothetical protein